MTLQLPRTLLKTRSGRFQTVYHASSLDGQKPSMVLLNSYAASIDQFVPQMEDTVLTAAFNLIAVGQLGHEIEAKQLLGPDQYTFWDQAQLVLDVMDTLEVDRFFIMGTSAGSFTGLRVALLAPKRVRGLLACGGTFSSESSYNDYFQELVDSIRAPAQEPFVCSETYKKWLIPMGWGSNIEQVNPELYRFLSKDLGTRFDGPEGQRRLWNITVELMERDTVRNKLHNLKPPIWVLHGSDDVAIPAAMMEAEFKWIPPTVQSRFVVIPGGSHFVTQTRPAECNKLALEMLETYKGQ